MAQITYKMDLEIYQDRIEKYLRNQLPPAEKTAFEAEMASSEALQQEVDLHRQALQLLESAAREELKNKIRQWRREVPPAQAASPLPRYRLAAAVALFFIVGAIIILIQKHRYSNEELAIKYFASVAEATTRGEQDKNADAFKEGTQAFEKKQYEKAIDLLSVIPAEDTLHYDKAQSYIGESYIWLKDFDLAAQAFQRILQLEYSTRKDFAQWNLLIAWLGAGKTNDPFKKLLQEIIQDKDHPYRQKAIQLQKDLNSIWR